MISTSSTRHLLAAAAATLLITGAGALRAETDLSEPAETAPHRVPENPYIVVFKDHVTAPRRLARSMARAHRLEPRHVYVNALRGFSARLSPARVRALRRNPNVAYIEQDFRMRTAECVPVGSSQCPWGVVHIDADLNATAAVDGDPEPLPLLVLGDANNPVDAAVIDTGIDLDDPDLNVHVAGSVNCIGANGSGDACVAGGDDDHGHGTHVAGTVAAIDNGVGVVGVAPGARLWAVKVLDSQGNGSNSDVIAAIDYVTAHADEIEVANMSLGGFGFSDALRTAIANSVAAGVVYVAAAGNDARDLHGIDGLDETDPSDQESPLCLLFGINCVYLDFVPAAYPEVAAVSASDRSDALASFSNFSVSANTSGWSVVSPGNAIDVAAPGVNIPSTSHLGSATDTGAPVVKSGTSMAAPHVAGAAALYIGANGRATDADQVDGIRQAIIDLSGPSIFPDATSDPYPEGVVNALDFDGPNFAPEAGDDDVTSAEDSGVTIDVLANDSDPNGDSLVVTSVSNPSNGRIRLNYNSTISYAPNAEFFGQDAFDYEISDGNGGTDTATVSVTVGAVNDDPITRADSARTPGDAAVTIDVLRNDTDPDLDPLRVTAVGNPANGVTSREPDDRITYTPNTGFYGIDTFDYSVSDDKGGSEHATVSVTVYATPGVPNIHVADLDAGVQGGQWGWRAVVTIAVADQDGIPVSAATLTGRWTYVRGPTQCITGASGTCTLTSNDASPWADEVVLEIETLRLSGFAFDPGAGSDPDGDSDGRRIVIPQP